MYEGMSLHQLIHNSDSNLKSQMDVALLPFKGVEPSKEILVMLKSDKDEVVKVENNKFILPKLNKKYKK
jgi:hypothetical protein